MNWTKDKLEELISSQTEENISLDYKASESFGRNDSRKAEITKDVSAFANSAGGTIIYGIKEYSELSKKHLPEKFDPVDRTQFTREWIEQIINNIRPRISNISIQPVSIDDNDNHVVYVVDIPQGLTAHQAIDYRYYKRFNFESVPMHDHEIRDVNARGQYPLLNLEFDIVVETYYESIIPGVPFPSTGQPKKHDNYQLIVKATNHGNRYAEYVNAIIKIPSRIVKLKESIIHTDEYEARKTTISHIFMDNTHRDVVGSNMGYPQYGPSRFDPILPKITRKLDEIDLDSTYKKEDEHNLSIEWTVYADNAPPISGEIKIDEIPFIDKRK